jgi:hypothetical protein
MLVAVIVLVLVIRASWGEGQLRHSHSRLVIHILHHGSHARRVPQTLRSSLQRDVADPSPFAGITLGVFTKYSDPQAELGEVQPVRVNSASKGWHSRRDTLARRFLEGGEDGEIPCVSEVLNQLTFERSGLGFKMPYLGLWFRSSARSRNWSASETKHLHRWLRRERHALDETISHRPCELARAKLSSSRLPVPPQAPL